MICAIRVRGTVNVSDKLRETLENMSLRKTNHMVLLSEEKPARKMAEKAKDYIAFGEISEATLAKVLAKRGRIEGDAKISQEFLKEKGFESFEALAKALVEGKAKLKELGIKRVFRLHPPRKGHKRAGVKTPFALGGALGYRGEEINKLIESMS